MLGWLFAQIASYGLMNAIRTEAEKKFDAALARREVAEAAKKAAAEADKKKKDKINCCAVPAEIHHFLRLPGLKGTLAVALLVLMCALAWYGGREIVNALAAWQKRAPVKAAPVVKVLPAAPRPPVPQKGNLSESIGWRQARAIAADEAAMVICVSGHSLLADRRLANGKWIAFAGDSKLTYDYVTQRWGEQ